MAERPILFSGDMVRAILDGRKTMTRRIIRKQDDVLGPKGVKMPFVKGDVAWVRETWSAPYRYADLKPRDRGGSCWYWADGDPDHGDWTSPTPSIHMPRWASRITLEITDVRVQRLQSISEEDALAEGFHRLKATGRIVLNRGDQYVGRYWWNAKAAFAELWDSINGAGAWSANPWIWAISFKRVAQREIEEAKPMRPIQTALSRPDTNFRTALTKAIGESKTE